MVLYFFSDVIILEYKIGRVWSIYLFMLNFGYLY